MPAYVKIPAEPIDQYRLQPGVVEKRDTDFARARNVPVRIAFEVFPEHLCNRAHVGATSFRSMSHARVRRKPALSKSRLMMVAGFPAATARGGTLIDNTVPGRMVAPSPTVSSP